MQGVPFVGRAGQLLTKIIEAIELKRDDVYIANVIKCRPPENRNPEPDEVETCEPFLFQQIDIIKPKVIVALGTFAAQGAAQDAGSDLAPARPRLRLPRREADPDVPSRVPAAQPRPQARGLGRHEESRARSSQAIRVRARDVASLQPSLRSRALVRVAVPVPALDCLTYRVPDGVAAARRRRARRRAARLARRHRHASSSRRATPSRTPTAPRRSSRFVEVLDAEPFLPADVVRAGDLGRGVLRLRRRRDARGGDAADGARRRGADAHKTVRVAAITAAGVGRRSTAQGHGRRADEQTRSGATRCGWTAPARGARRCWPARPTASTTARWPRAASARAAHRAAGDAGTRDVCAGRQVERDPFAARPSTTAAPASAGRSSLTAEQDAALDALARARRRAAISAPRCCTASPAAARPRSTCGSRPTSATRGRGVLMLVPEIALTPAVAADVPPGVRRARGDSAQRPLRRRAPRSVAPHPPRRRRRRRRHALGGVRAARALGLIVVDEEHDGSYKQEESPRYNGRDVAVDARARSRGAGRARLGDAVDGELSERADRAIRRSSTLDRRVLDRPLADVTDRRHARGVRGRGAGRRAERARCARRWRARSTRGEQAIVLLNRRGFATRGLLPAVRRDARLPELQRVADRAPRGRTRARCHYCNYSIAAAEGVRATAPARIIELVGLRHRARRGRGPRARSPTRASRASTATRSAGEARSRALLARFARAASSTSWSARR